MWKTSYLWQETQQQPAIIANLLQQQSNAVQALAEAIRQRNIRTVVIAARGSSDNAARYAQYVLGARNGLVVALATPSLFSIYHKPPQLAHALVLGISQSGSSPDLVAVLDEAGRQGALTAAITNHSKSPLAQQATHVLNIQAGTERSVAATKSYTASLAMIALLSSALAQETPAQLATVPEAMAATIAAHGETLAATAERYRRLGRVAVIGRGYNYATAFEIALKIKELAYIHCQPYSSADFMHGPLALVDAGLTILMVAPSGAVAAEMTSFLATVRQYQAQVMVISDDSELLSRADLALPLPVSLPEWLSPLVAVLPGQLLALHLAHACGNDLDTPRRLQKVTETL